MPSRSNPLASPRPSAAPPRASRFTSTSPSTTSRPGRKLARRLSGTGRCPIAAGARGRAAAFSTTSSAAMPGRPAAQRGDERAWLIRPARLGFDQQRARFHPLEVTFLTMAPCGRHEAHAQRGHVAVGQDRRSSSAAASSGRRRHPLLLDVLTDRYCPTRNTDANRTCNYLWRTVERSQRAFPHGGLVEPYALRLLRERKARS